MTRMPILRLLLLALILGAQLTVASAAPPLPPCPPPPRTPGVPWPPYPCQKERSRSHAFANLCLSLVAEPSSKVRRSEVVTYQLIARNGSSGRATHVQAVLPFVRDVQTVLDATFSSPDAWVS